jgi:hypothetical protein
MIVERIGSGSICRATNSSSCSAPETRRGRPNAYLPKLRGQSVPTINHKRPGECFWVAVAVWPPAAPAFATDEPQKCARQVPSRLLRAREASACVAARPALELDETRSTGRFTAPWALPMHASSFDGEAGRGCDRSLRVISIAVRSQRHTRRGRSAAAPAGDCAGALDSMGTYVRDRPRHRLLAVQARARARELHVGLDNGRGASQAASRGRSRTAAARPRP